MNILNLIRIFPKIGFWSFPLILNLKLYFEKLKFSMSKSIDFSSKSN